MTVVDDQKPIITVPANINVLAAAGLCSSNVVFNVSATDNCDPAPSVTFAEARANGSCQDNYTLTRTWTGTELQRIRTGA